MDITAIGIASIDLHLTYAQNAAGVRLMKGAMEQQETQAAQLIEAIEQAVPPSAHRLDLRV